MLPLYQPEIVDIDGSNIKTITDAISVRAARAFNTDGSATIVIPNYYRKSLFRMHTRMKLWRFDYSGRPALFGDTVWFLKKIDDAVTDGTYTLEFVDAFAMLNTRKVAYTSQTPYADKTLEEFELIVHNNDLRLDNMMRAYMRENFGADAIDTTRLNPYIEIDKDRSLAAFGEKQASWQDVGSVLNELTQQSAANGIPIYYDLIPREDGTFFFKVWDRFRGAYRGKNSRSPLVLRDTDGALNDIHEVEDYSNVATHCYALGGDSGASQVFVEVSDPLLMRNDPFGRIEMTVNVTDTFEESVLYAAGQAALNGRRPRRLTTAQVVESTALRLHRDLFYGDVVSVEVRTRGFDAAISAISTNWTENKEELDIRVSGEEVIGQLLTGGVNPPPDTPGEPPVGNQPPVVDAGEDQAILEGETATLNGTVSDDGLP